MSSKMIGTVVILLCLRSSMAFPVDNTNNGTDYPEKCDDRRRLCGWTLKHVVDNLCGPMFSNCSSDVIVSPPLYQNPKTKMFAFPRHVEKSCCVRGCTPRMLKPYICGGNGTSMMEKLVEEEEEKNNIDFQDDGEILKKVGYVAWNYYYKYLPHVWLADCLISKDAEPYFLWKIFQ